MSEFRRRLMMVGGGGEPPIPYQRVEYLESSGTQYIDTGIIGTGGNRDDTTYFYVRFYVESVSGNNYIIGARNTTSSRAMGFQTQNANLRFGYSSATTTIGTISANVWHELEFSMRYVYLDGVEIHNYTSGTTFTTPYTIIAFAIAGTQNGNKNIYYGNCRISALKINQMNLIPVRIETEGYMYDKVSGTLFGNDGTGNFILGNDVNT